MDRLGVVGMIADNTRKDEVIDQWLRRFNRSGVPLYVVLPADSTQDAIVLPEILTKSMVLEALEKASGSKG